MSTIRTITNVPARPFRLAAIGIMLMLLLAMAAQPAIAQTPAPAAPANLAAELTDTEGEILLSWDAAEGATSYRACRRVQDPPGGWSCVNRTTTSTLFAGLTVDTVYDFAVASYDGQSYSSWVWTEAIVEAIAVDICPITGLHIPDGYLSVNDISTNSNSQRFVLTGVTRQATFRSGGDDWLPWEGRQFVKVCGAVQAPANQAGAFTPGYSNNLATDLGLGFLVIDDNTTEWREVGTIPQGEVKTACDIWEIPEDATTVIYAVNNWNANPGVYRVELPAADGS